MARTYATVTAVVVVSVLFPILGIIAVILRFMIRKNSKISLWVDDWLVIPALILECTMAAIMIWGAATRSLGDLLPAPDVPGPMGYLLSDSNQQIRLQQIQYHVDWIGIFTFGILKLSILFFYRKIFCTGASSLYSAFSLLTGFLIGIILVWMIAFGIGAIFLCGATPENAWAPVAVVAQKCPVQLKFLEGYAISDFILDCIVWTAPIPRIWTLHISLRRKFEVVAVFLVGSLAIAASATRMSIYIIYIVNAFAQSDGETLVTYLLFWTMVECGLSLLVVCLPTLRPILNKILPDNLFSTIKNAFSFQSLQSSDAIDSLRLDSLNTPHKKVLRSMAIPDFRGKVEGSTNTQVTSSTDLEGQEAFHNSIRVTTELEQSRIQS